MFEQLGQTATLVGHWEAHAGAESTLNYAKWA
jgi:hypothetical protein